MRVPDITIEKAVSKEKSRYTLNAVLCDPANKRFAATTGHILAVIPFEPEEGMQKTLIPVAAIAMARKSKQHSMTLDAKTVTVTTPEASTSFPVPEGQFANIDAIIPEEVPEMTICLDAAGLLQLAQSLQERTGTGAYFALHVKDKSSVIYVKPANGSAPEGAFVLIMPGRVGETR